MTHPAATALPLFVDLDGTLIATDSLYECLLVCAKKRPLDLVNLPRWLARGRAYLKAQLAFEEDLNVAGLPYREDLCTYLRSERAKGRSIYLATAADGRVARRIAEHLGLFDGVLASDGETNLKGIQKLAAIRRTTDGGFAYAGNDRDDLAIWAAADAAILVNVTPSVARQVRPSDKVEQTFPSPSSAVREIVRAVRIHQWLKNLLVFVPLLTSFHIIQISAIAQALAAFFAFSLCASSIYVVNDLLDLDSDRAHPRKRLRPFASGRLSIPIGLLVAPVAMGLGLMVAFWTSPKFTVVILSYVAISIAYNWYFKTRVMLDVIVLACLYAIRILGGGEAIGVVLSVWLIAFALFVFLSLALLKRSSELMLLKSLGLNEARGRNYEVNDLNVFWPMGISTAVCSVLVFSLYINSAEMPRQYATPVLLWPVALGLFCWLGRMWIKTGRGEMTDDPLVYTIKDFGSRMLIAGMVLVTLGAYFVKLK